MKLSFHSTASHLLMQTVAMLGALALIIGISPCTNAAPTTLSIRHNGVDFDGHQEFELEWNAISNAAYKVQVSTNLESGSWETIDVVTPTGSQASCKIPPSIRGVVIDKKLFARLILPQPQIFTVEPAIFPPGAPVDAYVIGQCFETNDLIRVDGVPVASMVHLSANQFHGPLPSLSVGRHLVELVRGGVVQSSFSVTVADALSNPEIVLPGPPSEPPASPQALIAIWASKKGYDYYQATSSMNSAGLHTNPYFNPNEISGEMPTDRSSRNHLNSHGNRGAVIQFDAVNAKSPSLSIGGGSGVGKPNPGKYSSSWTKGSGASVGKPNPGKRTTQGLMMSDGDFSDEEIHLQTSTGELQIQALDFVIPGIGLDFAWTRNYRSRTGPTTAQGAGWDFSYNVSLTQNTDGTVTLRPGNGRADTFYQNGTNWTRDEYFCEIRDLNSDGMQDVLFADTGKWLFNPSSGNPAPGKLWKIVDRNNNSITLHYDLAGRLAEIVDTLDRTNTVAYDTSSRISSVTDCFGRSVSYQYDGNGDLVRVISPPVTGTPTGNDFPGGITNRYTYSSGFPPALSALNHNLTSCTDGKGQTWFEVFYQTANNPASVDFDRVGNILCGETTHFFTAPVTPAPTNGFATTKVIVRDAVGNVTEEFYDARQRCVRLLEYTGRAPDLNAPTTETLNRPVNKLRLDDPDTCETRWSWNGDSLCTLETLPGGQQTRFIHHQEFGPSRPQKRGDLRIVSEIAPPGEGADLDGDGVNDISELTWRFDYDPRFGSPAMTAGEIKIKHKGWDGLIYHRMAGGGGQSSSPAPDAIGNGEIKIKHKGWDGLIYGTHSSRRKGWDGYIIYRPGQSAARGSREQIKQLGGMKTEEGWVCKIKTGDTGRPCTPLYGDGFVTSAADPRGNVVTAEFDSVGNVLRRVHFRDSIDALMDAELVAELEYNANGQLTAITNAADANGYRSVTRLVYGDDPFTPSVEPPLPFFVLSVTDADGLKLTNRFSYDTRGNLTRYFDPRTNDWLFAYNALDQCVRVETPTNLTARTATDFIYDANGNVVQKISELRDENDALVRLVITSSTLDVRDRPVTVVDQVSASQFVTNRFTYDGNGGVILIESPMAVSGADPHAKMAFEYDERGMVFREIGAPGSGNSPTNEYSYDLNGRLRSGVIAEVGAGRPATVGRYNGFGWLTSVADPMSNVVHYTYDRAGNCTLVRVYAETYDVPGDTGNMLFAESSYRYDGLNRLTQSRDKHSSIIGQTIGDGYRTTSFYYAPNGACTNVTDDNGHSTRYAFDTAGRLASITDPKLNVQSLVRDAAGNVTTMISIERSDLGGPPQVFSRTNVFDKWDRLVSTTDNRGNNQNWSFGGDDTLLRSVDARGAITRHEYDLLGRKTKTFQDINDNDVVEPVDVVTTQTWDDNSRCISTTDGNTNTTFYAYDSLGNLTQQLNADGTSSSLIWSPRSNLLRLQDPNGNVISNRYDALDRLIASDITPGAGVATTTTFLRYAYDGVSRLVAATNDAAHNEFAFDTLGYCTSSRNNGWLVSYTHDAVGNELSRTLPSGITASYAYNANDEVVSVTTSGGTLPTVTQATIDYEGPGRIGRIARTNNVNTRIAWNGAANSSNASDDFGWRQVRGVNHQVAGGGAVIDSRIAKFDRNQNRTLRAQTAPFFQNGPMRTNTWSHDALNRVKESTLFRQNSLASKIYDLDANGNRTLVLSNGVPEFYSMDSTPLPGPADFQMNQYTMTPFAAHAYDDNGNRVSRNTTAAQVFYQYDYADRLVSVAAFDSGSGSLAPVVSYSYGPLGERTSKTVFPPAPALPVTTAFIYGGLDQEDDGDNIPTKTEDMLETRVNGVLSEIYVHVTGLKDEIRENDRVSHPYPPLVRFSPTGVATYLHSDDLGNVLALTDNLGNVIGRSDYDDFGLPEFLTSDGFPIATNASPTGNSFLFRGMEWDSETGLYLSTSDVTPFIEWTFEKAWPARWDGSMFDPQTGRTINGRVKFFNETKGFGFVSGGNPWSNRGNGGIFAKVPRDILKSFFEKGDKPTQSQLKKLQYTAKQGKTGSASGK